MVISQWGDGSWQDLSSQDSHHEAMTLRLSCEKAKQFLKWRPVLSINECMEMTAAWYKKYYHKHDDMYPFCVEQIERYSEKARALGVPWAM